MPVARSDGQTGQTLHDFIKVCALLQGYLAHFYTGRRLLGCGCRLARLLDVHRCFSIDAHGQIDVANLPFVKLEQIGDGKELTTIQHTEHGRLIDLLCLRQFFVVIHTLVPGIANGIEVGESD